MERRHLWTSVAVAKALLHFEAPLDRLYLSSRSVTKYIQAIEREMGGLYVGIPSNGTGQLTSRIVREFMTAHRDVQVTLHRLHEA